MKELIKQAEENYPPGTIYINPYNKKIIIVSKNNLNKGDTPDSILITGWCSNYGSGKRYVYYKGKWGEILEPKGLAVICNEHISKLHSVDKDLEVLIEHKVNFKGMETKLLLYYSIDEVNSVYQFNPSELKIL